MSHRLDDGEFVQISPASTWEFSVPPAHKFISVIGAFSADGMTEYDIDSQEVVNGILTVRFGIEQHSGVIKYSYQVDGDETKISSDGGTVNVTVHQYNNAASQQ